ncbi:MAG: hypothetical protein IPO83_01910 [Chitinophagaceae bacterium]|nr:hypothetical protein [Chitinophagaceae bacterium]
MIKLLTITFVLLEHNLHSQSVVQGYDSIANEWQKNAVVLLIEDREFYRALEAFDSCLYYNNLWMKNHKSSGYLSFKSLANMGKSYAEYLMGDKVMSEKFYKIAKADTTIFNFSFVCYIGGVDYMSNEQYAIAIRYIKAAIWRNEPKEIFTVGMYSDLGKCLFAVGDYAECINNCTIAINAMPGNKDAYYYRGKARIISNNLLDGCKDLSKAGELGEDDAYVLMKEYCR